VRHLDERYLYPATDVAEWADGTDTVELAEALRSALDEGYAEASGGAMGDALANVLDSMSPAEGFNFASALNRISKSAGQLVSDPTFVAVAQTALPIVAGAAGTAIGGPVGAALGSKLGSLAASALPARPAPAPAVPPASPSAPTPPVAAGSTAAAQGLILTQQPEVLRSLLATALGQQGRQTVSGIPVAKMLGTLSQIFGKAAADADELMYLREQPNSAESVSADVYGDSADMLYSDLLGADNQELAEAAGWDWAYR
jgi:hypothetical protein